MASCFSGGKAWMARMMWLSSSVMEAQKSQLLPCSSLPLQYMPGRPTRIQMGIEACFPRIDGLFGHAKEGTESRLG